MRYRREGSARSRGQALLEAIMVMPVLLLLMVAVADLGKFWVISGKSEISARYAAFRWQRDDPMIPLQGVSNPPPLNEIEGVIDGIFYNGSLDDERYANQVRSDDVGYVNYNNLTENLDRTFGGEHMRVQRFWYMFFGQGQEELRGSRSTFTYDLSPFLYTKRSPFTVSTDSFTPDDPFREDFEEEYSANGNFLFITGSMYDHEPGNVGATFIDNRLRNEMEAGFLLLAAPAFPATTAPLLAGYLMILLGLGA